MTNKRSRRHHIVPQFHLRSFTDKSGNLVAFDKERSREWSGTPLNAAVESDFYTIDTDAGPSDEAEKILADVEGVAAGAIARILAGQFPPSDEDREAVSVLLALQFNRGARPRVVTDDAVTRLAALTLRIAASDSTGNLVREHLREREGEVTEERVSEMKKALVDAKIRVEMPTNFYIRTMFGPLADYFLYLFKRTWVLVEGTDFVTTDEPVVLVSYEPTGLYGVGLANADEIRFALSPTSALCLFHPPELSGRKVPLEGRLSVSADQVEAWQRRFWRSARRFVFRHPATPRPV